MEPGDPPSCDLTCANCPFLWTTSACIASDTVCVVAMFYTELFRTLIMPCLHYTLVWYSAAPAWCITIAPYHIGSGPLWNIVCTCMVVPCGCGYTHALHDVVEAHCYGAVNGVNDS